MDLRVVSTRRILERKLVITGIIQDNANLQDPVCL
jgi:hypothetical protein